jgi:hypothetical protein
LDGRVPSKEGETNPIAETLKFSGVVLQDRSAGTALFRTLEGTGDVRVHSSAGSRAVSVSAVSDPVGGGSVSGSGSYHLGESVVLQATPSQGYEFEHWLEGPRIPSPQATLKLSPVQDRNFVAKFKSVFVPFDETLNFDDNQIPPNWELSFLTGSNGSVANQRFEARQFDTYAMLSRNLPDLRGAASVEVTYTGNVGPVFYGMGSQIHCETSDGTVFIAGFGKTGSQASTNIQLGRMQGPELIEYLTETFGKFVIKALFQDGRISIEVNQIDGGTTVHNKTISVPGFTLESGKKIRLFAITTTGESAWLDDVSIKAR